MLCVHYYLVRRCQLPGLRDVLPLVAYISFIGVSLTVAVIAAAGVARFAGAALQHASHELWDQPTKAAAGVSRSEVLDDDAFAFGYLKEERVAPRAQGRSKTGAARNGPGKAQPVSEAPWSFWSLPWSQPQPASVKKTQPRRARVSTPKYRTLCVRLCDGAYFPVSYSTSAGNFARDEEICQRSCTSPAKLYVYKNPGEEVDQMHDIGGEPYSKLSTAFLFRTTYDASCTCKPHPWEEAALAQHRLYAALEAKKKAGSKPGKQMARKGKPEPVATAAAKAPATAETNNAVIASTKPADAKGTKGNSVAPLKDAPEGQKTGAPKVTTINGSAAAKAPAKVESRNVTVASAKPTDAKGDSIAPLKDAPPKVEPDGHKTEPPKVMTIDSSATVAAPAEAATSAAPAAQETDASKAASEAGAPAAEPEVKKAAKRRTASSGVMVAGWRRSAGSAAARSKPRATAERPKGGRVYNGSDWRINAFQN